MFRAWVWILEFTNRVQNVGFMALESVFGFRV